MTPPLISTSDSRAGHDSNLITHDMTSSFDIELRVFADNFAPIMNGSDSVLVTDGYFEYTMFVNDSNGDEVTVTTNFNSTITMYGDDVIISGQITNASNFNFIVTVEVCQYYTNYCF